MASFKIAKESRFKSDSEDLATQSEEHQGPTMDSPEMGDTDMGGESEQNSRAETANDQ